MILKAWAELLQRYRQVWSWAWKHRAEMEPMARKGHEAEFLPAALALQETPASPAPRVAMWLIVVFFLIALVWAVLGRMDVVATAQGRIVPNDRTKTIQPLEAATVKAIHVSDGQSVKAGEVLIELDATTSEADIDRIQGDLLAAQLQVVRSRAMLAALDTGKPPILPKIESSQGNLSAKAQMQHLESQRLLNAQHGEYLAKLSRIQSEMAERQAQLQSTQHMVNKLKQSLPITRQRAEDYKNLVDKNFVSKHGYLEREQARIEQEGDLATQQGRLKEIEAALHSSRAQASEVVVQTRRLNLDSLNEGQQKAAALEQELLKADSRGKLTKLTSPVDGTVQQLAAHTVGGVVTPAQPLMVIVPRDNSLEVEAFIENKDIGFVKANQDAEVKIETFQYTKYGTLHAKVVSVSHDAINDEKRGLIYSSRVKMAQSSIKVDGTAVNLSPGMAVTVEIKTGQRRLIEYFLSPLLQTTSESMRER